MGQEKGPQTEGLHLGPEDLAYLDDLAISGRDLEGLYGSFPMKLGNCHYFLRMGGQSQDSEDWAAFGDAHHLYDNEKNEMEEQTINLQNVFW